MLNKLYTFLQTLAQVPGFDFVSDLLAKFRGSVAEPMRQYYDIKDGIGDAEEAVDSGKRLVGLEESGDGEPEALSAAAMTDDGDATIIRPRPGGRGAPAVPMSAPPPRQAAAPLQIRGSGLNVLVDAATELFSLSTQLRNSIRHPDPQTLRARMGEKISGFDAAVRAAGAKDESVLAARYALCTLLDESVLTTPWGSESQWGQRTLLSQFHNETWGGEKFFLILDRLIREPARHLPLLEFMYLAMALGLEGKYKVLDGGKAKLAAIQDNLFRTIRSIRGDFERELSPRWRGVEDRRSRLSRSVPFWTVGALCAVFLLAIYAGFNFSLGKVSEPVYAELANIGHDERQLVVVPAVKRTLTLRELLAADIKAGLLDVIEQTRGSTVEIHGDGLFASGSPEVRSHLLPLLGRIADAMNQFPGEILVTGHTDNQRLGVAARVRFPTNWHLSQARADAVAKVLAGRLSHPGRIRAEGRADSEPKVLNDTPEHRAQNRRVDVTLLSIQSGIADGKAPAGTIRQVSP